MDALKSAHIASSPRLPSRMPCQTAIKTPKLARELSVSKRPMSRTRRTRTAVQADGYAAHTYASPSNMLLYYTGAAQQYTHCIVALTKSAPVAVPDSMYSMCDSVAALGLVLSENVDVSMQQCTDASWTGATQCTHGEGESSIQTTVFAY